MKSILLIATLAISVYSAAARAEEDPFHSRLLPLELVMEFRKDIDLSRDQNRKIGDMVVELQKKVADKQWRMQAAYFDLIDELDAAKIDEDKTIGLLSTAMSTENEIKQEQIRFLIRLRNLLDAEQIERLREELQRGWTEK